MKSKKNLYQIIPALLICFLISGIGLQAAIPASQRAALISMYTAFTSSDSWGADTWKNPPLEADGFAQIGTEGTWFGITVVADQVTEINLPGPNEDLAIGGTLSPDIGNLPNLEVLDLNMHIIEGTIPVELGNLSQLKTLDLGVNLMVGSIPVELGNLTNLEELSLYGNRLTGAVPVELANLTKLNRLNLSANSLSGSIPVELANLSLLKYLFLYGNNFTGSIPDQLANLSNLEELNLNNNNFSGSIPAVFGTLSKLKILSICRTPVSGSIPSELGNLSNLEELYLYSNDLTGAIPPELGNLSKLRYLRLDSNRLSGMIPAELGSLSNLWQFYVDRNQLTGIPVEIGNLSSLGYFSVDGNMMVGEIPAEIVNLDPATFRSFNINFNGLNSPNPTVTAFLESLDYFSGTSYQTVAPANVSAAMVTTSSVRVSWDPIAYVSHTGGYMVYYSSTTGGPWTYAGITADKSVSDYLVTGLTPNSGYYFVVATRTDPHSNNDNTVSSGNSNEAYAYTGVIATNYTLNVQSSPDSGVSIAVSPADNSSLSDGSTAFTRTYGEGTSVTLTAPATYSGKDFSKWTVDGVDNSSTSVQFSMTQDRTAIAYYTDEPPPPPGPTAEISLNRSALTFGVVPSSPIPTDQTVMISNTGTGTMNWTASVNETWLSVSPASGTDSGTLTVSCDASGMAAGTYTHTISFASSETTNSPQTLSVTLNVYDVSSEPFGGFSSPVEGTTLRSSIPVTGWALDDVEVTAVKIYRAPVSGENAEIIYIGDAVFVDGARPDIEAANPGYPMNYRAGWGYMMLSNFLPGNGNGTFTFYAKAEDGDGNVVTLGSKTITCDNANAVKPFGAIDTPSQGGTANGSDFVNWGWVLTPQPNAIPTDGSTIDVWVDGGKVGNPTYNLYRSDIATLFPGYANSGGAVGYFYLDTTAYENGVHTIQWTATDDAGNTDGIGSRYFSIQNSSPRQLASVTHRRNGVPFSLLGRSYKELSTLSVESGEPIRIRELESVRIAFRPGDLVSGIMLVDGRPRALPIGSRLDNKTSLFSWQPGPGFLGKYRLVFFSKSSDGIVKRKDIVIDIQPGTGNR